MIPSDWRFAPGADRVELPRRARFQLELGARWSSCDRFRLLDPEGGEARVWVFEADSWGSQPFGLLAGGRSAIYAAEEGAVAALALLEAGVEVQREPVTLGALELTAVRID